MEILNRKAKFNYFIEDELECGIELLGNEVKSIREGSCNIKDSYARVKNNEIYIINMFIKNYSHTGESFKTNETRERRLLLHKKEIAKLKDKTTKEGYTLIPLKIYFNDKNKAKVLLGVCKGKKSYDKRETIKERDIKRKIEKDLKRY
ncbi:MAG: SsrA-binding protein SmpB [Bacilli bacterium]|nr:SsrA-binding protein SmpB [Bacilli bacterium]